mmetsp:Transcript_1059/g.1288  ORF Transcript_1059/g.1288 Transcript_1059/m.1288 type:complete len:291 (-) Transcript_1059:42-914(-)
MIFRQALHRLAEHNSPSRAKLNRRYCLSISSIFPTTSRNYRTNQDEYNNKEALISFLDKHDKNTTKTIKEENKIDDYILMKDADGVEIENERNALFQEAGQMTRSLYRACIRCSKYMRLGNENDEANFLAREEEQKANRSSKSMTVSFSFEPPVDRENELSSRASYYLAFTKESFGQEIDCLNNNPWREDNIERFLYLIRQGEEKRKWILNDYKFDDPYDQMFDDQKLKSFEERAWILLKKTYERNGWLFKSDYPSENINDLEQARSGDFIEDDDTDWDNDDDFEDKVKK